MTRLLPLLALVAAPAALAQPFFDAPWRAFEAADLPAGNFAVNLTAADLNGDGRPDAVTAQNIFFPGLRVFLNEGSAEGEPATFPDEGTFYTLSSGSWDVEARDFDGDGDRDLLSSNTDANYFGTNIAFLRNNGDGTFAAPQSFPAGGPSTGVAAADLDGDGDLDAAVANYGSFGSGTKVSILRNNGTGTFAAPVSYTVAAGPNDLEAGDLDGDGDFDLAVAYQADGGRMSVLRNNGNGTFAAAVTYQNLFPGTGPPELALANPDGDGDLDIVLPGYYDQSVNEARLALFRNNGSGTFTLQLIPYGHPYENTGHDIVTADLDGDTRDDLLVADYFDAGYYVFRDNNATSYLPAERYASVPNPIGVEAADLDGDGDEDVLTTSRIQRLLAAHENVGSGVFPERPIYGAGVSHIVLDLGDTDGDGDLDAVTSHGGASSSDIAVYRNDGSGVFTQSQRVDVPSAFAKFRDLDGDGVLDLLFVTPPSPPPGTPVTDFYTARGNGNGTFGTVVRHPLDACALAHPAAYDLDEDGDLDVVNTEDAACISIPESGRRLFISLNNGNSTFQPPLIFLAGAAPYNTAAGDFDEDGNLDLATASQSISAIVFGNGDGTFVQPEQFLPSGELGANILARDLDEDANLDLITLRDYSPDGSAGSESELVILFGNGTGAFTEVAYPEHLTQDFREWVDVGDVDGDGDLDVFTGGANDALVFLNDGNGALTFSGRYGIGQGAFALHYAEVTGDGPGDLVALNGQETPPFGGEYGIAVVEGLEGSAAPVTVSAQPVGGPIVIGPGGGSFQFAVTLTNLTGQPQTFQAWSAVTGPVNREPIIGPQTVTLPPGATITRTLTQQVPGNAPAGTYTYTVKVGTFPVPVLASDSFPVLKQGSEAARGANGGAEDWTASGAEALGLSASASSAGLPGGFALSEVSPNPFRRQASLTLEVAERQAVLIEVYDGLGRRVAVVHDGALEAGAHALVLDGTQLPAGVYVVRATGETFVATRRVTLVR
jgi:hypothetical protein